jgi:hypothetical protein
MVKKAPVFIVGVPRSGTTLLAAMLAAHPNMSCGPETHFFRWIERVDEKEICAANDWPVQATGFVNSIIRKSYTDESPRPLIEKYGLSTEQIRAYLEQQVPSVAAILSSITELHMIMSHKSRWVEKTPDHIEYLDTIRHHFPDAFIVRIVRDPRDIALSLLKVPWGVKSLLEGLTYWKRLDDTSRHFFQKDNRSHTLRFEDLIQNPETELRKLCEVIDEPFDNQMLDTSLTGKQLNSRNVPWKNKASQPVDRDRLFVWQKELSQQENLLAESFIGNLLEEYHYQRVENLPHYLSYFPSTELKPKYSHQLQSIAAQGNRFWKINPDEKADGWLFLGDPADQEWAKGTESGLISSPLSLSKNIITYKLANKKIYWIPGVNGKQWTGFSAFIIKLLLSSGRQINEETSGEGL